MVVDVEDVATVGAGQVAVGVKLNDSRTASTSTSSGSLRRMTTATVTVSLAGLATTTWSSPAPLGPHPVDRHQRPTKAPSS